MCVDLVNMGWWTRNMCLLLLIGLQIGLLSSALTDSTCDPSTEFPCRNNPTICIALARVRDGSPDCPDRSDEECNGDTEFQCQSIHQCIPKERFHDGWPDCDDGSDEECGRGQHRCRCGLPHCVDGHKVKDGVKDCDDGSDEEEHQNKTKRCPDEDRLQDLLAVEKRRKRRQIRPGFSEDGSGRAIPAVRVVPTRRAYIRRIKPAVSPNQPGDASVEGYNLVRNIPNYSQARPGYPQEENYGGVRNYPNYSPTRQNPPPDFPGDGYGPVRNIQNYSPVRLNPQLEGPVNNYGVVRNIPNYSPTRPNQDVPIDNYGPIRNYQPSRQNLPPELPAEGYDAVRNLPSYSPTRQNTPPPLRDDVLYPPNQSGNNPQRNQPSTPHPNDSGPPRRVIRLRRPGNPNQPRPQPAREHLDRKPIINNSPDDQLDAVRARGPVVVTNTATVRDSRGPNALRQGEGNNIANIQPQEVDAVPLTYYTTFTYMTTFLNGPSTAYSTREAVVSNIATETLNPKLVNLIRSRGGFTSYNGVQTAVPLGSRTQGATTTIVNLASRVQLYNSDVYYSRQDALPSSNDETLKPNIADITSTQPYLSVIPITDVASLPKTYYTLFTYYYTLHDGDKSTFSQRSETISNVDTQTEPFVQQNFESTIDNSGFLTITPDKEMVKLGLRTAGGITTEVNLELKTIVHFEGLKNVLIDRGSITPSLVEIIPTETPLNLNNYLEPDDAEVQDQHTYPQTVPIQPSFSSGSDIYSGSQRSSSSNEATPEIPKSSRVIRTQSFRGPLRVASTVLQRPGTLRSGVFAPRPGVRVRVRPVTSKLILSESEVLQPVSVNPLETSFEAARSIHHDTTTESDQFDDEDDAPETEEEEDEDDATEDDRSEVEDEQDSKGPLPGRKRLKITIRRSPGTGISRTNSRFVLPSRTRPRFYVVTRTGSPDGSSERPPNRPTPVKVSRKPRPSEEPQYETYTTLTSVPVVFGLSTTYRNALVTSSSLVTPEELPEEPSKTVVLTYFTTTTYTVPYTVDGRSTYTTLEETNSRIVTETLDPNADLSFISTTTLDDFGGDTTFFENPDIPESDVMQTLSPQTLNNQLNVGGRVNLVTKISNGVTLIVATDGTEEATHVVTQPTLTLQPTMVTDALLMVNKDIITTFEPRTFYTTFTFFTTFFSEGTATISTSEQVITNVYSVPVTHSVSNTSPAMDQPTTVVELSESVISSTMYSTHTFYATLFNGTETVVTPLEELQSSVISSTETYTITKTIAPTQTLDFEMKATEVPQDLTTTTTSVYRTLTNFVTLFRGSESIVSPLEEIVTDIITLTLDNRQEQPSVQPSESYGTYTTRTVQATNTHYITLFSGTQSILSSITEVAPSVITELVRQLQEPTTTAYYTPISSTPLVDIPGASANVEPTFQDLIPSVRTQYTTLTYFTTLFTDSSTILSSREEVATSYITLFVPAPLPGATSPPRDSFQTDQTHRQDITPSEGLTSAMPPGSEILTFYTTYTYYTTLFRGTETIISDSETVVTQYVTIESTPTDISSPFTTTAPPAFSRPSTSGNMEVRIEPTTPVLLSSSLGEIINVETVVTTGSGASSFIDSDGDLQIIGVSTKVGSDEDTPSILTGIPSTDANGATHILFTDFIVPSSINEPYSPSPDLSSQVIIPSLRETPSLPETTISSESFYPETVSADSFDTTFFSADTSTGSSARAPASDQATTRLTDVNVATHHLPVHPTTTYHSGSASTLGIKPGAIIDLSDVLGNTNLVGNLGETIKDIVNLFAVNGNRLRNNSSKSTQRVAEQSVSRPSGGITISSAQDPVFIPIGAIGRSTKTTRPTETKQDGGLQHPSTMLSGFTPVFKVDEKYTFDGDSNKGKGTLRSNTISGTSLVFGSDTIFIQPTEVISGIPATQQFTRVDGTGRYQSSPSGGVLQGSVNKHDVNQHQKATPGISNTESTTMITGLETIFFELPDGRQPPQYTGEVIESSISTSSIVGVETIFFDSPSDAFRPGSSQINLSGATTIFGSFPATFGSGSSSDWTPDSSFTTSSSGETTIFFPVPDADQQQHHSSPGTRYVTSVESVTLTLTLTTSTVYHTQETPVTVTSVFTTTIPPRTFVSTIIGSRTILGTQPEPTEAVQVIPTMQPSESTTTVTTTTLIFNSIATTVVRTLVIPTQALLPTRPVTESESTLTAESPRLGGGNQRPKGTTERPSPVGRKPIQLFKSGSRPTEPTTPKPQRTGPPLKLFPTKPPTTTTIRPPTRPTSPRKNTPRKPGKTLVPITDGCIRECNLKNKEVCKQNPDKSWSCQCRPGFFRKEGTEECKDVKSYVVLVRVLKMDGNEVTYNAELNNYLSPEYKNLTTTARKAVDDAYKTSSVGDNYVSANVLSVSEGSGLRREGVLVNLTVQLSGEKPSNEEFLRDELALSFEAAASEVNFANETVVSAIIQQVEDVQDFDECAVDTYNDCSRSSVCLNLPGTYTCECREGYQDLEPLLPGRICSGEIKDCDYCNNRGVCIMTEDDNKFCRCYRMYLGKQCEINGLVLAIALPIALALLILTMFCLLCGCRKLRRRRAQKPKPNVFKGMVPPMAGTLDRKAMIMDSSSESSGEHRAPAHAYDGFGDEVANSTMKRSRRSNSMDDQMSAEFQVPTVLIPRAKHSHPKQVNAPYPNYRMPSDVDRW